MCSPAVGNSRFIVAMPTYGIFAVLVKIDEDEIVALVRLGLHTVLQLVQDLRNRSWMYLVRRRWCSCVIASPDACKVEEARALEEGGTSQLRRRAYTYTSIAVS